MLAGQAAKLLSFAEAVNKLKQAADKGEGATLDPDDVTGLIWGIQLLKKGSEDAADPS